MVIFGVQAAIRSINAFGSVSRVSHVMFRRDAPFLDHEGEERFQMPEESIDVQQPDRPGVDAELLAGQDLTQLVQGAGAARERDESMYLKDGRSG